MRKTFIFGNSQFAKMIKIYLDEDKINFGGFVVDKEYINGSNQIDLDTFLKNESLDDSEMIIAIGYDNMNDGRKNVYLKLKALGIKIKTFVHKSAVVSSASKIGEGSILLENVVVQPFVEIGSCNILWSNCSICHDTTIGDFNFFAASSTILGKVLIGNNCFIGAGATIKNRVSLCDYSLIGAAAFCDKDILDPRGVILPTKSIQIDQSKIKDIMRRR